MMHITSRTIERNGNIYDIDKLINIVKNRNSVSVAIAKITGASKSKRTGFSSKRLKNTDIKYPVLLHKNDLIDGRHRVIKLKESGNTHVNAINITHRDLHKVKVNRMMLVNH